MSLRVRRLLSLTRWRVSVWAVAERWRFDGGTVAPCGCGGGCGRAVAGTAPVTNFAKPEISDRGRDAVRGVAFGGDRAHYRLVTERPGVW